MPELSHDGTSVEIFYNGVVVQQTMADSGQETLAHVGVPELLVVDPCREGRAFLL